MGFGGFGVVFRGFWGCLSGICGWELGFGDWEWGFLSGVCSFSGGERKRTSHDVPKINMKTINKGL